MMDFSDMTVLYYTGWRFVNSQGGKELRLFTVEKVANRKTRFAISCEFGYGKVSRFELMTFVLKF